MFSARPRFSYFSFVLKEVFNYGRVTCASPICCFCFLLRSFGFRVAALSRRLGSGAGDRRKYEVVAGALCPRTVKQIKAHNGLGWQRLSSMNTTIVGLARWFEFSALLPYSSLAEGQSLASSGFRSVPQLITTPHLYLVWPDIVLSYREGASGVTPSREGPPSGSPTPNSPRSSGVPHRNAVFSVRPPFARPVLAEVRIFLLLPIQQGFCRSPQAEVRLACRPDSAKSP